MLKYCLDTCDTKEMGDKSVVPFLPILKFTPHWFVTSKMNKKRDDDLFSNDNIIFVDEDSNNVTFLLMK